MKRPTINVELLRKKQEEQQKTLGNLANQMPIKEGQLYIHGYFKNFIVWVAENGGTKKTKQETPICPETTMIYTKDKTKQFPASFTVSTQLKELTGGGKDECEKIYDNTWKVLLTVTYSEDVKQYMRQNYEAFYNGELPDLKFPIGEYISPDGEFREQYWRTMKKKDLIEISVNDNDDNIFRAINEDGSPKVDPYTELRFGKCVGKLRVYMRDDYTQKDPLMRKKQIPGESVSFDCKGQTTISVENDDTLSGTERIHHLNDVDAHTLIPFADLVKGAPLPNETSFEYICDGYCTSEASGKEYGVLTYLVQTPENELKKTFQKQVTYLDSIRWTKYQFDNGTTEKDRESYFFCTALANKGEWRKWGIMNPDIYMAIRSHAKIPLLIQVNWSLNDILMDESNIKGIENIRGIYRGYVREYDVDFVRGLPNAKLGGIKISKARVETEFSKWRGKLESDNTITITLSPSQKIEKEINPLHGMKGLNSPVIALGNGKVDANTKKPLNHAFAGDIYPILEQSDFYVLINKEITDPAVIGSSGVGGDAYLDGLITQYPNDFQYFIYAYNKPAVVIRVSDNNNKRVKVETTTTTGTPVQE
jgi:hypothetical protein